MKKLFLTFISIFYPIYRLKDCSVADKKQREKNYKFNQENRFLLLDCAMNCGYFFCWCLAVIHLLEKNQPPFYFHTFLTASLGVACAITFTMAAQQMVIFIFLSKEEPI